MTPSKDLFELIKSMSKAEKAHFNRYSQLHASGDQKNYLLLFDAIDQQKEYDEEKLRIQLKEYDFDRYFPFTKNYLYGRILDSLEIFHRDMNVQAEVRRAIHRADILQTRGLNHQSAKVLKNAKRDAAESELHPALLELSTNFEYNDAVETHNFIKTEHIHSNILKISSDLKDTMICINSRHRMLAIYLKYFQTRNKKHLQDADKLIQDSYFTEAAKTQTYRGKLKMYETYMLYWHVKGRLDLASHYSKKALEHHFTHPAQLKKNQMQCVSMLNNFFTMNMERKRYDLANIALQKFREVSHLAKTHSQKSQFYYFHTNCLLDYLQKTGDIGELEKKLPVIIKDIDTYQGGAMIRENIFLLAGCAISYLYLGNTKKCIFFLNKLNNENNLYEHPEVQYLWYLLSLIAHNDLGNYDTLQYLVQNFYRFIQKKKQMSAMEKSIVTFLRKVIIADSEQKIIGEFKNFKNALLQIENDPVYDFVSRAFDIISWLESKIQNRPFTEIVKEKAKSHARMSSAA